jgi:hypothetical protein
MHSITGRPSGVSMLACSDGVGVACVELGDHLGA